MKKLIALVLILALALCCVACDSGVAEDPADSKPGISNRETDPKESKPQVSDGKITVEMVENHPANPESDFVVYDLGDGLGLLDKYVGSDEIVTIPDTVDGLRITRIAKYAFANDTPIKGIKLSNSIEYIEDGAFGLNKNLQVFIGGTGLQNIGIGAFQKCSNLTVVIIKDGLKKIENQAFNGCSSLNELELPASVEEITKTAFFAFESDFVLIGEAGSYVEEYAKAEGITFRAK